MTNIHPIIVHFPIALLITGFGLMTLSLLFRKGDSTRLLSGFNLYAAAYYLLVLGALSVVVALCSGYFFTQPMAGPLGDMRQTHFEMAAITAVVSLLAAVVYTVYAIKQRRSWFIVGYALYLIAVVLIGYTGHLGGQIVYMFR